MDQQVLTDSISASAQQGIWVPNADTAEKYAAHNSHGPFWSLADLKRSEFSLFLDSLPWDSNSKNHNKAHYAALRAASLGIRGETAFSAIEAKIRGAGGRVDHHDLSRQVRRGFEYIGKVNTGEIKQSGKVTPIEFSPALLEAIACKIQVDDPAELLRQRSPVPVSTTSSADFLNSLYQPGEQIIVFTKQQSRGHTPFKIGGFSGQPVPAGGPDGVWFLVQPVDGKWHHNPREGKRSRRSKEAVLRWPYLVLESDVAETGHWLRLLLQLALPIVAIYTSGGRSVHALVRVDAADKEEWDRARAMVVGGLVPLGADQAALSAVRLSRLPQCRRGEKLQELLYLNPAAAGTPIWVLSEEKEVR